MCPRHHGRAPPLLGAGSIAEWSVAAADADGVHLARGAEGLVAGGGDQTRGRGGTGLAVHDSCDTQKRVTPFEGSNIQQDSCSNTAANPVYIPKALLVLRADTSAGRALRCRGTTVALLGISSL